MTIRRPGGAQSATRTRTTGVASGLGGRWGGWGRFLAALIVTGFAVVPIAVVVYGSLTPAFGRGSRGSLVGNFSILFWPPFLGWLRNSLVVTLSVVLVAVAVAAPAGYVLSRGRGALVSGFSLALFVLQSFPVVLAVVPLCGRLRSLQGLPPRGPYT